MAHYPTTPSVVAFQYELLCQRNLEFARNQRLCAAFGAEVARLDTAVYDATVLYLRAVAATQSLNRATPNP
nr:hypothetical protein [uncultured Dongia sp.]